MTPCSRPRSASQSTPPRRCARCCPPLKLLRLRFGELPEQVVARVRAADAAQIEGWIERVITSPTLDDVLTDR
ncbi:hypothetical protein [Sorangium sp. So ce1389]|uniref:hypothetical protein n=1 Tax=Sorangium sp. So ce1389 TaxID=3133336 RepID=UPI003F5FA5AE